MAKYDSRFAGYATRVAFDLRLTRTQIFYLSMVDAGYYNLDFEEKVKAENEFVGRDIFVPQVRGLIERGLVEHQAAVKTRPRRNSDWVYRLTPAGSHVFSLLQIAGLAVKFAVNEEKAA